MIDNLTDFSLEAMLGHLARIQLVSNHTGRNVIGTFDGRLICDTRFSCIRFLPKGSRQLTNAFPITAVYTFEILRKDLPRNRTERQALASI